MSRKIKRSAAFSDALFELDSYRNAVNRATFYERKLNETREQLVLPKRKRHCCGRWRAKRPCRKV